MSDDINQDQLTQAYELIEADKLDEALTILEPIVTQGEENADAWWLYAHAVTDVGEAHRALSRVLTLEPDYDEATELLNTLEDTYPDFASGIRPAAPTTLPGIPDDDDLVDLFDQAEQPWQRPAGQRPRSRRLLFGVLIILALVAVVSIGLILTSGTTPSPTQAPTEIAQVAPTSSVVAPTPTAEDFFATDIVDPLNALYPLLQAFAIADGGIVVTQTAMGKTLLVTTCATTGLGLGDLVAGILNTLSGQSGLIPEDVNAIGVQVVDCEQDNTLRIIGVGLEDALEFSNGNLDEKEFQRRWQPIG